MAEILENVKLHDDADADYDHRAMTIPRRFSETAEKENIKYLTPRRDSHLYKNVPLAII